MNKQRLLELAGINYLHEDAIEEEKTAAEVGLYIAKLMMSTEKSVYADMVDDDPKLKEKYPDVNTYLTSLSTDNDAMNEFADNYLDDIHVEVKKNFIKLVKQL